MVALDKLTNKFKGTNAAAVANEEQKDSPPQTQTDQVKLESNTTNVNLSSILFKNQKKSPQPQGQIPHKRFIAEVTQEVLIVTDECCYISKQDSQTGMTYLYKLNDIKDVLNIPQTVGSGLHDKSPITSPGLIKPGQSASGTPTQQNDL